MSRLERKALSRVPHALIDGSDAARTVHLSPLPTDTETPTMLYVHPNPNAAVRLDRCGGERYDADNREFVPCGGGCEAHFDANNETEYGDFYNPYPNSILSWINLLPGTEPADELIPSTPRWAFDRLDYVHRNDTVFHDADGHPVTAWVVRLNPAQPDWHFAVLFSSRKKQLDSSLRSLKRLSRPRLRNQRSSSISCGIGSGPHGNCEGRSTCVAGGPRRSAIAALRQPAPLRTKTSAPASATRYSCCDRTTRQGHPPGRSVRSEFTDLPVADGRAHRARTRSPFT